MDEAGTLAGGGVGGGAGTGVRVGVGAGVVSTGVDLADGAVSSEDETAGGVVGGIVNVVGVAASNVSRRARRAVWQSMRWARMISRMCCTTTRRTRNTLWLSFHFAVAPKQDTRRQDVRPQAASVSVR